MKNKLNRAFMALILAAMLPLSLMAQSGITEPGATEPNQLYTTTYDNPTDPNHASGPNRATMNEDGDWLNPSDPLNGDPGSPIGAPWALLAFAAAYAGVRLVKRGKKSVEE